MKKITQVSMLLIALIFMNANSEAQSGDFEFLFESTATDGSELEGWTGGSVASGVLTFTYGSSTARIDLIDPPATVSLKKADYPYIAIKLSATPSVRRYMFLETTSSGGATYGKWYLNKANPVGDTELDAQNIFFYDIAGPNFTDVELEDGQINRLLFNFEDDTAVSVDVEWIKTFASVQAIKDYQASLGLDDVANKSQMTILSGDNKIEIKKVELNAKVEVFSLLGKRVFSSVAKSEELAVNISVSGIYIYI